MTKSMRARLRKSHKITRERTYVKLQRRFIHDGTGREVFFLTVPRWAVKKVGARPGDSFLVDVQGATVEFELTPIITGDSKLFRNSSPGPGRHQKDAIRRP
jgi:hypothetical protein